jgi:hypothetical protein
MIIITLMCTNYCMLPTLPGDVVPLPCRGTALVVSKLVADTLSSDSRICAVAPRICACVPDEAAITQS